jgi:glycosyltransferase involved in cell wall biosynthesis
MDRFVDRFVDRFDRSAAPSVSVVIPAYNAARFIGGAIESVLAQTYADYEIIVVDDGSRDETATVVSRFGQRVRLISQANGGASAARNRGIREAAGSWIAFLDSDDEWQPSHLAVLLARAAQAPEAHLIYGSKITVNQRGEVVPWKPTFPSGWIFGELVETCLITTSTIMVRAATLRALGAFTEKAEFRVAEDWDLYLRLAAGHQVAAAPDTCVTYRRLPSSLSHEVVAAVLGDLAALRTAERLLAGGSVAPGNHPERIDLRDRWRRAYREGVVHLFTSGEYELARRIGTEALRRGFWTFPAVTRTLLSSLPSPLLVWMRDLMRTVRRVHPSA